MSRSRRLRVVALLLLGASGAFAVDVLVLDDGRRLSVDAWWVQGERVVYEKYGGTVAIPRERILEILEGEDGPDRREGPPEAGRSYAPTRPEPPAAAGPVFEPAGEAGAPGDDVAALEARLRLHPAERPSLAPRLAQALTLRGNAALRGGDPDAAARDYERAVGLDPSLVAARVNLAAAYLALDRNREALSEADVVLRDDPRNATALYLRGEALYRDERMDDAIRAWERAEEIAPSERTRERLTKALREQKVGGAYLTSAAAHFLLRYDGQRADDRLGEEILEFLEDRFNGMVSRFNFLPESVIVVILYPSEEFHDVTQTASWTGGLFDGKIRVPVGGARSLNERLRRALVHELTHSFVHGKSRGNCPAWLQEGLAQIEEGKRASAATLEEVARAYRSVDAGLHGDLDYDSSLAFTEFLVSRHGLAALLDLLERLGRGVPEDRAMRQSLGQEMDGLLRDWGESLARGMAS